MKILKLGINSTPSKLAVGFIFAPPIVLLFYIILRHSWSNVVRGIELVSGPFGISAAGTLLFVLGTGLAAFDMFFDHKRLAAWDNALTNAIAHYEASWLYSLKQRFTLHDKDAPALMMWGIMPLIVSVFALHEFGIITTQYLLELLVLIFMLDAMHSFLLVDILGAGLRLVLALSAIETMGSTPNAFLANTGHIAYLVIAYTFLLLFVRDMYKQLPRYRAGIFVLFLVIGAPYVLVIAASIIAPFALFSPIHFMVKLILALKPTSAVRVVGLIIVASAYLVDKY